jgi:hypothetical protein
MCGLSLLYRDGDGPQVALMQHPPGFTASVREGEIVTATIVVPGISESYTISARAAVCYGKNVEVSVSLGADNVHSTVLHADSAELTVSGKRDSGQVVVRLRTQSRKGEAAVLWSALRLSAGGRTIDIPLSYENVPERFPPSTLPQMRPAIQQALIEWDWRMQDGVGTPRVRRTYAEATGRTLRRGYALIRELRASGIDIAKQSERWQMLWRQFNELSNASEVDEKTWEDLWRRVHVLRRRIAFANPLAKTGPLLFVKQVPGSFSHQLTQYYGRYARPGGGLFVLDNPGHSMSCTELTADKLPVGSYQQPDVSYDGKNVIFAFCPVAKAPRDWNEHADHFFNLYEISSYGQTLRQLTDGDYDDFSPKYLPNGKIVFVSTRGVGYSRCGPSYAASYNLSVAEADGSNPRLISFHETHEWDPAVLNDGRVIYTRWDYVDRDASHYQQLWATRPDGSNATIFYGNMTLNPIGTWEARAIPNSNAVMATTAAHHAMTAGSIVLVGTPRGVDGLAPLTRLTPDVPFPESEFPVKPNWHAPTEDSPRAFGDEYWRWPGHCYRSPYPLSEDFFLVAYSFDALTGEEGANPANMFGIYLADRFGNKELLYRDLNIASLWPVPLRPRPRPPRLPDIVQVSDGQEGTFFLQNVYEASPALPPRSVKRLRILQVLPKSTPIEGDPPIGLPNAAPGKNVLGTVPVESDGSACFRAPAGVPLAFQALDETGQAVQIMRSLTYLQPGEAVSCIGCHEHRMTAPATTGLAQALNRPPSTIEPGPEGSNPMCYPILVQPVLDRHCLSCHSGAKRDGGIALTGRRKGNYTVSYHALGPFVSTAYWGNWESEPLTRPGHFGAKGSSLTGLLLDGHGDIQISEDDWERLITWMDANALFYGTFDRAEQARQKRGERIASAKETEPRRRRPERGVPLLTADSLERQTGIQ